MTDPRRRHRAAQAALEPPAGAEIATVGDEGACLIVDRIGDSGVGGVMTGEWPTNSPITEIRFKTAVRARSASAAPTRRA